MTLLKHVRIILSTPGFRRILHALALHDTISVLRNTKSAAWTTRQRPALLFLLTHRSSLFQEKFNSQLISVCQIHKRSDDLAHIQTRELNDDVAHFTPPPRNKDSATRAERSDDAVYLALETLDRAGRRLYQSRTVLARRGYLHLPPHHSHSPPCVAVRNHDA